LRPGSGDFFSAGTIQDRIAADHGGPLKDIGELAGVIPDDEIEDFVKEIHAARDHS
jgi:hypothetical protein